MGNRLFQKRNLGFFVIAMILISVVSVTTPQFSILMYSDNTNIQSSSTLQNDYVEIHDTVLLQKNHNVIPVLNSENYDPSHDTITISDHVILTKTIPVSNTIFAPLAIMGRIFEQPTIINNFDSSYDISLFQDVFQYQSVLAPNFNLISILSSSEFFQPDFLSDYASQQSQDLMWSDNVLIIFIIPLVGYVFLRVDGSQFKLYNYKKAVCYSFVVLLLSSAIITPFSISTNYWGQAFAEESSIDVPVNATTIAPVNSTTIAPVNATTIAPVNATTIAPVNATTIAPVNATTIAPVNATTIDVPVSDTPTITDNASVARTISISDVPTITDSAIEDYDHTFLLSLDFENDDNVVSKVSKQLVGNNTVAKLDGSDDFITIKNQTKTDTLSEFTLSLWIKPDYTNGSPEFTLISKTGSFSANLNNKISPEKIAKFSVYDGMKWKSVESTSQINDEWTHVAATFNGTNISIFVNGVMEETTILEGVLSLAVDGKLETKSFDNIHSSEDIVVGAYLTSKQETKITNKFSGYINDVSLFSKKLTQHDILRMYENQKSDYTYQEKSIDELLAEIIASANQTSLESIPMDSVTSSIFALDMPTIHDLATKNSKAITTETHLEHDVIEINKSVTWTQTVSLSNQSRTIAIELPSDAEITRASTNENNTESILYESDEPLDGSMIFKDNTSDLPDRLFSNTEKIRIMDQHEIQVTTISTNNTGSDATTNSTYVDLDEIDTITKSTVSSSVPLVPNNITNSSNFDVEDSVHENSMYFVSNKTQSDNTTTAKMVPVVLLQDKMPELLQKDKPTKLLVVNNTATKVDLTFKTPAPYTTEKDQSTENIYNKKVTVAHESTLHYSNVKSYSDIPERLVKAGVEFKLFWNIDGIKTNVTHDSRFHVEYVDTDGNGIANQMQWIVPQLSEQEFEIEADIVIINVQSYPVVGGNWTVNFTTIGTADLIITAVDGTTFGDGLPDDLKFLELHDGTQYLTPIINGNIITYLNYSSTETGFELSEVITHGKHHLMFQFGNDTQYAHNSATSQNMLVYRENDDTSIPQYKTQTQSGGFGSESNANDVTGVVDTVRIVAKPDNNSNEKILCVGDGSSDLNCQVWNGVSWSAVTEFSANIATQRAFSLAYINSTHAMVCYREPTNTNIPYCDIWNGSNWNTSADALNVGGALNTMRLIADPNSNYVALMTRDGGNDVNAQIFDGVSWSNLIEVEANAGGCGPCFSYDGRWESSSADFLAVWYDNDNGVNNLQSMEFDKSTGWSGTTDSDTVTVVTGISTGSTIVHVESSANPSSTSDQIIVAVAGGGNDLLKTNVWNGATWGTQITQSSDINADGDTNDVSTTNHLFDIEYEGNGDQALLVYGQSNNNLFYRTYSIAGGTWSTQQDIPDNSDGGEQWQLAADPALDDIMLTTVGVSGSNNADVETNLWSGSSWGSWTNHETSGNSGSQTAWFVFGGSAITNHDPISVSDAPTISDSAALVEHHVVPASDTPTITDSSNIVKMFILSVSDAPTISDAATMNKAISLSDAPTITDSSNIVKMFILSVSDAPTISDSAALVEHHVVPVSDTPTITDSATMNTTISVSDAPTISDSATMNKAISLSDAPTITDSADVQAGIVVFDTPTISDSATMNKAISLSDAPTISDSATLVEHHVLPVSDAPTISDSATMNKAISLSDAPTITDSADVQAGIVVFDTPTISDSATLVEHHVVSVSDTPTITDSSNIVKMFILSLSDTPTVSDAATMNKAISLTDTPAISDNASTDAILLITDTPTVSDAATIVESHFISVTDTSAITDSANLVNMFQISVTDAPTISDAATMNKVISLSDTPTITDNSNIVKMFILSLSDAPTISDAATMNKVISLSDTPTITDNSNIVKMFILSLSDTPTVSDAATIVESHFISVTDTPAISDNASTDAILLITDTPTVSDAATIVESHFISVTDTPAITDSANLVNMFQISVTDTPAITDSITLVQLHILQVTDTITISDSVIKIKTPTTVTATNPITITPSSNTKTITVAAANSVIVLPSGGLTSSTINVKTTGDTFLDSSSLAATTATTKVVTYDSGFTVNRDENNDTNLEVTTTFFDNTKVSGTNTWDGKIKLLTATTATIPTSSSTINGVTTTTTYETPAIVIELGSTQRLSLDKPIRLEFPAQGNKGLSAFFKQGSEPAKIITTVCVGDTLAAIDGVNGAGQLKADEECWKDDGDKIYIYSFHMTSFGVSRGTSSSSGTSSDSSSSGSSSGGGRTGVSTSASAAGGFGGILSSPLAINEISYDKCSDNMARIIVSSDADTPPTVRVSTAKSGVVFGTLAEIQPYAELNEFSTVDRYLYEVPISSDESFMMIVVTEEIGTKSNVIQTSMKLLSCEGTTVIVPLPEDILPKVSESNVRIFDTTIQIGNDTRIDVTESEFQFISGQDLRVSAIIDSDTLLKRVELRSIIMGEPDDKFMSVLMDVQSLFVSNSTSLVSGVIPSIIMVEPGMKYWLHVTDENGSVSESTHYNIGVNPTTVSDVAIEVDVPTIIPSGSTIKPEFYIFNENSPTYGIVSLVVDGDIVSKKSQLFGTGQTQIIFNWNIPKSNDFITYDFEVKVDLYDITIITESVLVSSHPKTISVATSDMPVLQVITQDGQVLVDPALVYASNANSELRFKVTDPQGQCIIGGGDECIVKDNTLGKRGGLESIPYGEQILRVKYSGADNPLERFIITSIDPIIGQWNVTLESDDEFVQQAHASEDPIVKITYRYHSETISAKSQ
ncbi:MAG: LamG-like jellyroll fold domain-containing protein [Candidatus Nitrosopumilus sp. bin_7KS]